MNVSSIEFIFLLLVGSGLFFWLPGRHLRLAALGACNAIALALLMRDVNSWLVLAAFLASGYLVAQVLMRNASSLILAGYLVLLLAAFLIIKKYEFISFLPELFVDNPELDDAPRSLLLRLFDHKIAIVGLSYMLFRQIHFIVDAMQGQIERASFWAYLNYQLNLFTILAGPIMRFQEFQQHWESPQPLIQDRHDLLRALLRINVGVIKLAAIATIFFFAYEVASNTLEQVSNGYLLQSNRLKHCAYFAILFYSFPLYLYFNFSGYCDIVIGGARLIGMKVPENFDQPYLSRNMIDFWNRYHRTLSHWIRDYIFMPLYKSTAQISPSLANPLAIVFLFVSLFLAGLWHGSTINWVVYGALNGLGVAACELWQRMLIWYGGRAGLKKYMQNSAIRVVATVVNLNFACVTFLFFPIDMPKTLRAINVALFGV